MKLPLLSSTATSNCTVVTSLLKVGRPSGTSLSFFVNWDGILGSSVASCAGASFFFGFATVSDDDEPGPCAEANRGITPAKTHTSNDAIEILNAFIGDLEVLWPPAFYSKPSLNYRKVSEFWGRAPIPVCADTLEISFWPFGASNRCTGGGPVRPDRIVGSESLRKDIRTAGRPGAQTR